MNVRATMLAALPAILSAASAGCASVPYITVGTSRARAGEVLHLTLKTPSGPPTYWGYFVPRCGGVGLERQNGDAWEAVKQGPWPPCTDEAYGYGFGSQDKVDFLLPGTLPPGSYRVTTGLWTDAGLNFDAVSPPFAVKGVVPQNLPSP